LVRHMDDGMRLRWKAIVDVIISKEVEVEVDVDVDVDGAVQLRRPMLKPASTLRQDDDSRDEASLSCCVTCCQAGLCRALHRDHGA
jgi:hypothetical protein